MYELSLFSVDRTFLLISWDLSGVIVGNKPSHLVVQSYNHRTHLLELAGSILRDDKRHLRILPISLEMDLLPFLVRGFFFFCKNWFSRSSFFLKTQKKKLQINSNSPILEMSELKNKKEERI